MNFVRGSLLLILVLMLSACQRTEPQPVSLEGNIFGTFFIVTIGTEHDPELDEVSEGVMRILNEVDRQMSTYRSDSVLNQVNTAPLGEAVEVPAELFYVLQIAEDVSVLSGGAFDATIGGLVNLWGFGPEGRITSAPAQAELEQRLAEVGFRYVELGERTVTRHSDVFIDLSGIAKGYAVDAVSEYLHDIGLTNHLVNIGGDLRASGMRSPERQWRVGIEAPNDSRQVVQQILPVQDVAVLGSGDYRNYFEEDGIRYSHTINPTTGRPIAHRLAAVHVAAETAVYADAWATALLVLGESEGLALANEHGVAALFIYRNNGDFESVMSETFERDHADQMYVPTVR
ncbi:MAG: FAD:protein FMN transferase [Idiomarina sp.]|nr:FAD:protein FMN transferase [Idiomarina sp.]